jgi:hypothetical protein
LSATPLNAANLSSGTIPNARFPNLLPVLDGSNLFNLPAGNLTGVIPSVTGQKPVYYVADGDSLTGQTGPVGALDWFDVFTSQSDLTSRTNVKNYGFAGKTQAQIESSYFTAGGSPSNTVAGGHQFSPAVTGGKGQYFLWSGTNDLGNPAVTDATVLTSLQNTYAFARSDGYYPIVGFTVLQRSTSAGWGPTQEGHRVALNNSLRALTLGGSNTPDILIDVDRLLPNFVAGLYNDPIHLNAAGQAILAKYVYAKLNGRDGVIPLIIAQATNGSQTFTGTESVIQMGAIDDTLGLFDGTANTFLCPRDGRVEIRYQLMHQMAAIGDQWTVRVMGTSGGVTNEISRMWRTDTIAGSFNTDSSFCTVDVTAGELIDFRIKIQSGVGGWALLIGSVFDNFSMRYIEAP